MGHDGTLALRDPLVPDPATSWNGPTRRATSTVTIPLRGSPESDPTVLTRRRSEEPGALSDVVARYGDRIFRALVLILKDPEEARDLTQETFIRYIASLSSYRGEVSLRGWLLKIATNLALSRLRARERLGAGHRPLSLDQVAEPDVPGTGFDKSPEEVVIRRLEVEEVTEFLKALSHPLRAVAVLRFHEELSYEEIARVLEINIGTVRSRLNAVRWQARALFHRR
jgi:RNA polymerase sigma-70 factor (ECF subfamily)